MRREEMRFKVQDGATHFLLDDNGGGRQNKHRDVSGFGGNVLSPSEYKAICWMWEIQKCTQKDLRGKY